LRGYRFTDRDGERLRAWSESGEEEFNYTGKRQDATGLYYFGARYYDPETGRFVKEDPIHGCPFDPETRNRMHTVVITQTRAHGILYNCYVTQMIWKEFRNEFN